MRRAHGSHCSYTVIRLDSYGSHTLYFTESLCVSDINSPRMDLGISEMKKPHIRSAWLSNTPRFPCTVSCGVWCSTPDIPDRRVCSLSRVPQCFPSTYGARWLCIQEADFINGPSLFLSLPLSDPPPPGSILLG